jgi:hypothetical protein
MRSGAVEWQFEKVTFSREFPRNVVTRALVDRAEQGGCPLAHQVVILREDHADPARRGHARMVHAPGERSTKVAA